MKKMLLLMVALLCWCAPLVAQEGEELALEALDALHLQTVQQALDAAEDADHRWCAAGV